MDTLTFISELVKALAWPLAAIAIALLFREQLRALLTRIRKGKVGFTEFEFEQEVRELVSEAPEQPQSDPQIGTPTIRLATDNPRVAVVEAWLHLQESSHKLAKKHGLTSAPAMSPTSLIRTLEKTGAVSPSDLALLNDLRVLRNRATHDLDFSPSPESVVSYVQLARSLQQRIETAVER